MIQKTIDEEMLKFEEKPMQVDTNPFQVQANYVEPVKILMVRALIGTSKLETLFSEDEVNQALEKFEKEEEYVFPYTGDMLLEFLTKKHKAGKEVMICPWFSVVLDKTTTMAFEASNLQELSENSRSWC